MGMTGPMSICMGMGMPVASMAYTDPLSACRSPLLMPIPCLASACTILMLVARLLFLSPRVMSLNGSANYSSATLQTTPSNPTKWS